MGKKSRKRRAKQRANEEPANGRSEEEAADEVEEDEEEPVERVPLPFENTSPLKAGAIGAVIMVAFALGVLAYKRFTKSDEGGETPPAKVKADKDAPAEPTALAESEPNDSEAEAQKVGALPATVSGELKPGDLDLYQLELERGGPYLVDVEIEGLQGVRVAVGREVGKPKTEVTSPVPIESLGLSAGRVIVSVGGGNAAVTGAYRLVLRSERWLKGSEFEPNDSVKTSDDVALIPVDKSGKAPGPDELPAKKINRFTLNGNWAHAADIDCHRIPLEVPPTGAVLRIELTPSSPVTAELWVEAENENEMARLAAKKAGDALVLPALGARSWEGAYTLCARIKEGSAPADASADYRLRGQTLGPGGASEFEPNGTISTASALPRSTALAGYLTEGDVDLYRISAGEARELAAELQLPDEVACELSMLDDSGKVLASKRAEPGAEASVIASGATLVRLQATSGENLNGRYQLRVVPATEAKP